MSLYSAIMRPLLFRLDAEAAHHLTIEMCRVGAAIPGAIALTRMWLEIEDPLLECEVAGLRFKNPIGLAAGWDKSGRALRMLDALGFGFAEIGSVSARPSVGNPRPRLFRLPADDAIIVNYGLPNDGAEIVGRRLAAHRGRHPIGVNIVKTNDGPDAPACEEEAIIEDYVRSVSRLQSHASYMMLNLSCPNAVGGEETFARAGSVRRLLERLVPLGISSPVFLKVAPRDDSSAHERLLRECESFNFVRGFCFNLPTGKPETLTLKTPRESIVSMPGAVAGKPVEALINRCIAGLYSRMDQRRYAIIGAGGVFSAEDAYQKIRLGASLVQIYTAMIYHGPGIVKRINHGLADLMIRDGFTRLSQVVGTAHRDSTNQTS